MRKAIVAVFVMGLMAVSAPAMAQIPGSLDPLGLATSGFVIPYVGGGSNQSWLEVAAPVTNVDLHAFFYDQSCVRNGPSVGIPLTTNDVELIRLDNLGDNIPQTGLMAAAVADGSGFILQPIPFPGAIHSRVYWADTSKNRIRVLEPIALSTLDNDIIGGNGVWNPLRTGATFFAPLEGTFNTTLYFICPTTNIAGTGSQLSTLTRAFGPGSGFPELVPNASSSTTLLHIRLFDDEENFLRDVTTTCSCFTVKPVTEITSVYADANVAPFGTYNEIGTTTTSGTAAVCSTSQVAPLVTPGVKNSGNPCPLAGENFCAFDPESGLPTCQFIVVTPATTGGGPFAFTGYKAIDIGAFDAFGRLSNGNKCDIQGFDQPCGEGQSPNHR